MKGEQKVKDGPNPSSAGTCSSCGVYAQKRYGGMGRYLPVCLDCWIFGCKNGT